MIDIHVLAIVLAKLSFRMCVTSPEEAVLFNRTASRVKRKA